MNRECVHGEQRGGIRGERFVRGACTFKPFEKMKPKIPPFSLAAAVAATAVIAVSPLAAADTAAAPAADETSAGFHHVAPPPVMAIYDVDRNGYLDEDEHAVLVDDIASGEFTPPPGIGWHHRGRMRHGPPPEILAKYDANKNGRLDDSERAALHADIMAGKVPPPHHGRRIRMMRHLTPELIDRYDANKDGALDATERAALHADIRAGKVQPPCMIEFEAGTRGAPPAPSAEESGSTP